MNGLSPIIRIGKGAIMKTVQAWLRETNATEIIDTYLVEYPIDFPMLEDKKRTVAEVLEAAKENLGRLIQYLSTMEADYSEDGIFYAVHVRENQFPKVQADLSMQDEICLNVLPEHYAWDFTPWEKVMGFRIADTKLTLDHMETVLAQILYGMTFCGSDHETWKREVTNIEESLRLAEEEAKTGKYVPAEEVFAEFGLPKDEPDEIADALSRKVNLAAWEYDQHCRKREAGKVRELLRNAAKSHAEEECRSFLPGVSECDIIEPDKQNGYKYPERRGT